MENHPFVITLILALLLGSAANAAELDAIAEGYVRLQLAIGARDPDHVWSYYGPPQWRTEAAKNPRALDELRSVADSLLARARAVNVEGREQMSQRRLRFLLAHLEAARFRLDQLAGVKFSFDEEARRLFGVDLHLRPLESYDATLARIEALVPGPGALSHRVEAFRNRFAIPVGRIAAVMQAAVEECRQRTRAHIELPSTDAFSLELVSGTGWSGNNVYHGDGRGTVQINTDFPVVMDRVVELACHESYPGHHTHISLLHERLARQRGWIEYSVFPLFGPIGFIAEGEASYAYAVAFPRRELEHFESTVLYPLAGLDAGDAPKLRALRAELGKLQGARLTIGRRFLDNEIDRNEARALLQRYQLVSAEFADEILAFMTKVRSYIINYGLGESAVRDHMQGLGEDGDARWRALEALIAEPTLPADLRGFR